MKLSLVRYAGNVINPVVSNTSLDKHDNEYFENLINTTIKEELGLDVQIKLSRSESGLQVTDIILPAKEVGKCGSCGGTMMLLEATKVAVCENCAYERAMVAGVFKTLLKPKKVEVE